RGRSAARSSRPCFGSDTGRVVSGASAARDGCLDFPRDGGRHSSRPRGPTSEREAQTMSLSILVVGIVSLLLGIAGGILVGSHAYLPGIGCVVLSLLGWGLTARLATAR